MTLCDIVVTRRGVRFLGRYFPAAIGRGGITADKREGDGATPCGEHRIAGMMYRPDRMTRPAATAIAIGPRDLWSDDVTHAFYNKLVRAPCGFSHERMRRSDRLYDLVLILDWNWPEATPGRGSAIFIHAWRKPRHPTEGCVAFRRDHLRWIAERITPHTRVIVR